MIDLYFWPTPNGWKITIMLEELNVPYNLIPVNIGQGDQFKPEFLKISPNNRMPAIIDYPLGERSRQLADHRVVEQVQRLRGDCRIGTLDAVRNHLGQIERLENRRHVLPPMLDVDRTSPAVRAGGRSNQAVGADTHRVGRPERRGVEPS